MTQYSSGLRKAYTVQEVAELTGYHQETIRIWIRTGQLPAFKLGGRHYRISSATVEDLVNGRIEGLKSRCFKTSDADQVTAAGQ